MKKELSVKLHEKYLGVIKIFYTSIVVIAEDSKELISTSYSMKDNCVKNANNFFYLLKQQTFISLSSGDWRV